MATNMRIYLAVDPVDMRKSFNGLHTLVVNQLKQDPLSGHLFVFCNRPRNRIKVLYWDGSGLWVCAKRLEKGRFGLPKLQAEEEASGVIRLSPAHWAMLTEGIDLTKTRQRRWYRMEDRL